MEAIQEQFCSICRKKPARLGLKTCKPCVDQAILRRDTLKKKRESTKSSVKTSAQLAEIFEIHGFSIKRCTEEDETRDEEAMIEIEPNIIVQISWKRVVTPDLTFGPDGFLRFGVPTSFRVNRTIRTSRDYSYGVAPAGHTYGVTIEPPNIGRDRQTAIQIGYYENIEQLVNVISDLVKKEHS